MEVTGNSGNSSESLQAFKWGTISDSNVNRSKSEEACGAADEQQVLRRSVSAPDTFDSAVAFLPPSPTYDPSSRGRGTFPGASRTPAAHETRRKTVPVLDGKELLPPFAEDVQFPPRVWSGLDALTLPEDIEIPIGRIDFRTPSTYAHSAWLVPFFYGQVLPPTGKRKIATPLPRLIVLRSTPKDATQGLPWQSRLCYNPRSFNDQRSFGIDEIEHYGISLLHLERYAFGHAMMRLKIPIGYDSATSLLSHPIDVADPLFRRKIRAITTAPTGGKYRGYVIRYARELQTQLIKNVVRGRVSVDTDTAASSPSCPVLSGPEEELELWIFAPGKDAVALDGIASLWTIVRLLADTQKPDEDAIDWLRVIHEYKAFEETSKSIEWVDRYLDGCDRCRDRFTHDEKCISCLLSIFVATYAKDSASIQPTSNHTRKFASFLLVEYPGYGMSGGTPSKLNLVEHTVKSILEAIRVLQGIWRERFPRNALPRINLNFHAFSLGCAVVLATANALHDLLPANVMRDPIKMLNSSVTQLLAAGTGGVKDSSFCAATIRHCILFAPFLSARRMGAEILQKILFKPISLRMVNWFINEDVDWDNTASVKALLLKIQERKDRDLAPVIKNNAKIVVIHGEDDEVVSIAQCDEFLGIAEKTRLQCGLASPNILGVRVSNSGHCDIVLQQHVLQKLFHDLYS